MLFSGDNSVWSWNRSFKRNTWLEVIMKPHHTEIYSSFTLRPPLLQLAPPNIYSHFFKMKWEIYPNIHRQSRKKVQTNFLHIKTLFRTYISNKKSIFSHFLEGGGGLLPSGKIATFFKEPFRYLTWSIE